MNQEQKDRILSVIDRDAAIRQRYINNKGEFCVIGGLLDEIGVNVKRFYGTYRNQSRIGNLPYLQDLHDILGLTPGRAELLQITNDCGETQEKRRIDLRKLVNSWKVS